MMIKKHNVIWTALVVMAMIGLSACSSKSKSKADGSAGDSGYDNQKTGGIGLGLLDRVYFDFDRAELSDSAKSTLKKNSETMNGAPKMRVLVEGHCDERGTTEYNVALGERRAKTALDYLVSSGVARSRLEVKSWGEEKPIDMGRGEEAYSKNRRGEFVILEK